MTPKPSSKGRRWSEAGLSLVEMIVVTLVVTLVGLVLLKVYYQGVRGVTDSWIETRSVAVGQRLMGTISRMKWDETPTAVATIGLDSGETHSNRCATCDDIDDWNGYIGSDLLPADSDYVTGVVVDFVVVDGATGVVSVSATLKNLKRVTIDVSKSGKHVVSLSALFPQKT